MLRTESPAHLWSQIAPVWLQEFAKSEKQFEGQRSLHMDKMKVKSKNQWKREQIFFLKSEKDAWKILWPILWPPYLGGIFTPQLA